MFGKCITVPYFQSAQAINCNAISSRIRRFQTLDTVNEKLHGKRSYWAILQNTNSFHEFDFLAGQIPYGLAVRIPGFHPGGPGSTPGMGTAASFFFFLFLLKKKPLVTPL